MFEIVIVLFMCEPQDIKVPPPPPPPSMRIGNLSWLVMCAQLMSRIVSLNEFVLAHRLLREPILSNYLSYTNGTSHSIPLHQ
jgi:hypothetical protein